MSADIPFHQLPIAPLLEEGMLALDDGQQVAYEVSGVEHGVPALYLHGGPGGRLTSGYRRNVPVDACRAVGMTQRGAPGSIPTAADASFDLASCTTDRMIADIEAMREHLEITAWIVQGVSWGSTLALAYAQAHPERVLGIVCMAVTSTSRREVDWITEGVGQIYPEAWDRFASFAERHGVFDRNDRSGGRTRLVEAYRRLLAADDHALVAAAAEEWMRWEDAHIAIGAGGPGAAHLPDPASLSAVERREEERYRLGFARLVTHVWAHDAWRGEHGILDRMDAIADIPGVLIHGRKDVSGPAITAWELHRAWPASRLIVVEEEGHGGPIMAAHWRDAMHELVARVRRPTNCWPAPD